MKLNLIYESGTLIASFDQAITVPVPHKGDDITHSGKTYTVIGRRFVTKEKSELTGLRYPEIQLIVQNLN